MTGLLPQFHLAPGVAGPDTPVRSREDLVAFLAAGERPAARLLGIELERVPLLADGTAAPFGGAPASVERLLQHLARVHGHATTEVEGRVVGLSDGAWQVHLEPGAQVEVALPPRGTAREVLDDLRDWEHQLAEAAGETGVHVAAIGLQPVTPVRRVGWVPKERYAIMSEHLGARGALAHHMMKATAGVQFTLDYATEDDAAAIVRVALAVSPIVNAMAVNSPLEEARPNGWLSKRPEVWRHTDPDRTGLLPWVFDDEGYRHARYVDWALGVPVMFVVRDERWIRLGDLTFGELLERGHPLAGAATHGDFALHLTTLFPEVRVKQHVEIRGADTASPELSAAIAALWRGVAYDGEARAAALELTAAWTPQERAQIHSDSGRFGLGARIAGSDVRNLARRLLKIAEDGIDRVEVAARAEGHAGSGSDAPLLDPLHAIVESAVTPAERLLTEFAAEGPRALLRRV